MKSLMWREVFISLPTHLKDDLSGILFDEKTKGINEAEPDSNSPDITSLKAYFQSEDFNLLFDKLKKRIEKLCSQHKKYGPSFTIESKIIKEKDWGCSWAEHFKPVNAGSMLVISPPWIKRSDKSKRINIAIYPGMAFGTGTHESTRLCLKMIEYVILSKEKKIRDSFLDIGTGSGILSISARKLGFKKCRGIDIDEDAIRNARHNLRINGIGKGVNFSKASPQHIRKKHYSFVAANMILSEHNGISRCFPDIVKPNGFLAVSGLIKGQEKDFLQFDSVRRFFKKEKTFREKEWCGILLRKI